MSDVDNHIVPGLTNWESPNFFAYFKPHASYPSILGELLTAGLNVMGFSWIASPACTELETIACDMLGDAFGLPPVFLSTSELGRGRRTMHVSDSVLLDLVHCISYTLLLSCDTFD